MCILHIYEAEFIWSIGLNAIKSVLLWNITFNQYILACWTSFKKKKYLTKLINGSVYALQEIIYCYAFKLVNNDLILQIDH